MNQRIQRLRAQLATKNGRSDRNKPLSERSWRFTWHLSLVILTGFFFGLVQQHSPTGLISTGLAQEHTLLTADMRFQSWPLFYEARGSSRPCCTLAITRIFGIFHYGQIADPDAIGTHSFMDRLKQEHNGHIYTCRGGIADLGHIRYNADITLMVFGWIHNWVQQEKLKAALPKGGPTHPNAPAFWLMPEGGQRGFTLWPEAKDLSFEDQIRLAQVIAYDFGIWHEILTWWGVQPSIPLVRERISAFSPEDNYSNYLGTKVAAEAIRKVAKTTLSPTLEQLEQVVQAETVLALQFLQPVHEERTRRVILEDAANWFHFKALPPSVRMVRKRHVEPFGVNGEILPWTVSSRMAECGFQEQRVSLPYPVPTRRSKKWEDYYTLNIVPKHKVRAEKILGKAKGFYTQEDLRLLIENVRVDMVDFFNDPDVAKQPPILERW